MRDLSAGPFLLGSSAMMSGSVCRCNRYIVSSFRVHLATCWHRSAAPGRRDLLESRQLRHYCRVHRGRKREGSDRPALDKALAAARVRQVPLVVAKVAPWRAVVAKLVVPTESLRAIATAILAAEMGPAIAEAAPAGAPLH
jgi:hypothetical protein